MNSLKTVLKQVKHIR